MDENQCVFATFLLCISVLILADILVYTEISEVEKTITFILYISFAEGDFCIFGAFYIVSCPFHII
jgi:hypothetical protein